MELLKIGKNGTNPLKLKTNSELNLNNIKQFIIPIKVQIH